MTNKQSLEDIDRFWINEVESYAEKNVELLLIGNKNDMEEKVYEFLIYTKCLHTTGTRLRQPEENGPRRGKCQNCRLGQ